MEFIDFKNKKWQVVGKVSGDKVDDHTKLKENYGCDMVIRNSQNIYFVLNEIIDVEYEDV